jgi:hypothetical protein
LSLTAKLLDHARKGPAMIRRPLRAAWHLWQRLEDAARAVVRLPDRFRRRTAGLPVLGIYHFQEHAGYLGDMMEFLAVLNVLRAENASDRVDLCYINDPSNPNQPISRSRVESSAEFLEMMLSLRALLPGLGEVRTFDSDRKFEAFFREHYDRYVCWPRYRRGHSWPSRVNYGRLSTDGIAYPNTYAPVHRFFRASGTVPKLSAPPPLLQWARAFVREQVHPGVPIAVQIRFNPESPVRNTDIEAWMTFFRRMETRCAAKFVVLCRREEIVPELRSFPNVVFSKDHASGVLEDIALLQVAHFSMFPDAGFATYPWFCGTPTIFFGRQLHEFPQRRMQDVTGTKMPFLSEFQRRRFGPYTAQTLEEEFLSLWDDLARAGWRNPYLTSG